MINLILTFIGVLLLFLGFYLMRFGFYSPPNFILFFSGLCLFVIGLIVIITFIGDVKFPKISNGYKKGSKDKSKRSNANEINHTHKKKENILDSTEKPIDSNSRVIKAKTKSLETIQKSIKTSEKVEKVDENKTIIDKSPNITKEKIKPKARLIEPKKVKQFKTTEKPSKSEITNETCQNENQIKAYESLSKKPRIPIPKKSNVVNPSQQKKDDDFVKKRLDRLKKSYIENAKDIENVDKELYSFKGTFDQLKSEPKEPSIIWSFDDSNVQDTMNKTIVKANNRILAMYPWIRNMDVNILKKIMETESYMIIQEASLDDDASVELLRLLINKKNVKIRTMPYVHTIAVVSDDNNGLIISTDPIYESYEVGVIYKDQDSVKEIEHLFKDAWNLSKDINLEINS